MIPTVLVIAGSDPTGGAGIQADLKTLTGLGVYGAAAITCITVQNSQGVSRIEPLAPELVQQQIEAVLADHLVTHVKIGMIGSENIARILGDTLQDFPGEIFYDPVITSTTGHNLLMSGALGEIQHHLLYRVTVLTPNIPELTVLTGQESNGKNGLQESAQRLFDKYPLLNCVVVKGGHGAVQDGLLTDYCFFRQGHHEIQHKKVSSSNTHGTGCTLASALCAYHLKTGDYRKSFIQSVSYMQRLLEESADLLIIRGTTGQGPMLHARISEHV